MKRIASVALLGAVALWAVAGALSGCALQDKAAENTTGKIDVAKDAAAKAEALVISTGIKAFIANNGFPPDEASQDTLGGLVSPWPTNPFTKAPMKAGSEPGDYVYKAGSGTSYSLQVNLSDGSSVSVQ